MKISLKSGLNQNKRDSEVTEKEERHHRANRVQLKSSKPRTPSPESTSPKKFKQIKN